MVITTHSLWHKSSHTHNEDVCSKAHEAAKREEERKKINDTRVERKTCKGKQPVKLER